MERLQIEKLNCWNAENAPRMSLSSSRYTGISTLGRTETPGSYLPLRMVPINVVTMRYEPTSPFSPGNLRDSDTMPMTYDCPIGTSTYVPIWPTKYVFSPIFRVR